MARLTIFFGDEKKNVFQIRKDLISIGRGESCDVEIPASSISRRHATIERRVSGYYIVDNKSTNGTMVNGLVIDEARLSDGDEIYMGEAVLLFSYDEKEYEETAQEPVAPKIPTSPPPPPEPKPRAPSFIATATTTTKIRVDDLKRRIEELKSEEKKKT